MRIDVELIDLARVIGKREGRSVSQILDRWLSEGAFHDRLQSVKAEVHGVQGAHSSAGGATKAQGMEKNRGSSSAPAPAPPRLPLRDSRTTGWQDGLPGAPGGPGKAPEAPGGGTRIRVGSGLNGGEVLVPAQKISEVPARLCPHGLTFPCPRCREDHPLIRYDSDTRQVSYVEVRGPDIILGHAMAYLNEQTPRDGDAVEILSRAWGQCAREYFAIASPPLLARRIDGETLAGIDMYPGKVIATEPPSPRVIGVACCDHGVSITEPCKTCEETLGANCRAVSIDCGTAVPPPGPHVPETTRWKLARLAQKISIDPAHPVVSQEAVDVAQRILMVPPGTDFPLTNEDNAALASAGLDLLALSLNLPAPGEYPVEIDVTDLLACDTQELRDAYRTGEMKSGVPWWFKGKLMYNGTEVEPGDIRNLPHVEITQEMTIEEAKQKFPATPPEKFAGPFGKTFLKPRAQGWSTLAVEIADCADCQAAKKHAYSDATTPGFFYTECTKHRQLLEGWKILESDEFMAPNIDEIRAMISLGWLKEHPNEHWMLSDETVAYAHYNQMTADEAWCFQWHVAQYRKKQNPVNAERPSASAESSTSSTADLSKTGDVSKRLPDFDLVAAAERNEDHTDEVEAITGIDYTPGQPIVVHTNMVPRANVVSMDALNEMKEQPTYRQSTPRSMEVHSDGLQGEAASGVQSRSESGSEKGEVLLHDRNSTRTRGTDKRGNSKTPQGQTKKEIPAIPGVVRAKDLPPPEKPRSKQRAEAKKEARSTACAACGALNGLHMKGCKSK